MFHEIRPVRTELFHAERRTGRTDGHTDKRRK